MMVSDEKLILPLALYLTYYSFIILIRVPFVRFYILIDERTKGGGRGGGGGALAVDRCH